MTPGIISQDSDHEDTFIRVISEITKWATSSYLDKSSDKISGQAGGLKSQQRRITWIRPYKTTDHECGQSQNAVRLKAAIDLTTEKGFAQGISPD